MEDNSSEPSSSTGTRQSARGLAAPATSGYDEQGESDGVVPTTPKLPLPRRNDGFAEAVSSPQVKIHLFQKCNGLYSVMFVRCQCLLLAPEVRT